MPNLAKPARIYFVVSIDTTGAAFEEHPARELARILSEVIDKVENGDILVAPTTAPSFIMGMHRAVAFVTDEGGITCHAVIVSRELKIPCIVGTSIATKSLKDGDHIEVDANKGIVKKL